jgi:hypothetical protein
MRILVWGAGKRGKEYLEASNSGDVVIAFIDNDPHLQGTNIEGIPVLAATEISIAVYDKIIVSVYKVEAVRKIEAQLKGLGIPNDKIRVLSRDRYDETDYRIIWLRNLAKYFHSRRIEGNVAECGVHRGHFAKYINKYFQDRTLYLFDTFDGFDADDLSCEREINDGRFMQGSFNENSGTYFKNSSVEFVLENMFYPENCIIKKGRFPETAADVQDVFCFVNLDMDLYKPTLGGLGFFYEKMAKGGVILLHDFIHEELPGIAQAVDDFEKNMQQYIPKTVIGDGCSIALIKA